MGIQPVGGPVIQGLYGAPGEFLTPDALMTYCETRLHGLDSQVQAAFLEQQKANDVSTTLSDLLSTINFGNADVTIGKSQNGQPCSTDLAANAAQILKAADACTDPAAKQKLVDIAAKLVKLDTSNLDSDGVPKMMTGSGTSISAQDLLASETEQNSSNFADDVIINGNSGDTEHLTDLSTNINDNIKNIQQDINSGSELSMISLQSLMSQRQEAIQVCTNLVQSLGDQCNKIAENVGH